MAHHSSFREMAPQKCGAYLYMWTNVLRITIELLPHGDEDQAKLIAQANIVNNGSGTRDIGNYNYVLGEEHGSSNWKASSIEGFPRERVAGLNVWDLVYRVLHDAVGGRNK